MGYSLLACDLRHRSILAWVVIMMVISRPTLGMMVVLEGQSETCSEVLRFASLTTRSVPLVYRTQTRGLGTPSLFFFRYLV